MILFKSFIEVPEDFMYRFGLEKVITYNLTSYFEFPFIKEILPDDNLTSSIPFDSVEFDSAYSNFIISNDNAFNRLMSIILPVYNEPDVLVQLLISNSVSINAYRNSISENIAKLIQQRYGYNCYIVYTIEDLYYVRDDSTFSIPGLMILNRDLERYAELVGPITGEIFQDE